MNVRSDGVVALLLRRDTEHTVRRTERFQSDRRGYIADSELITVFNFAHKFLPHRL